ncbi:RNA-dependent RNA polymerase [Wenzhou weivirus-like virus 1]|uniref:RNA-dependent RNA polymerase n=1 Tax=Wenzhou weivirus-like virus 1 TaxID=1923682 RepID=UPI00090B69F1|nr:RNA-dependent RNA polymerase [Wenzhou weivirus-like virus 1]APG78083.1 RNA-dependent RNA polymerase [Wenzhou weivirus-like virus 1]
MLSVREGFSDLKYGEVAPYLRERAAKRQGEWTLTVHEAEDSWLGILSRAVSFKVVLTEEEYAKLSRALYHGIRNGTKKTSLLANLENTAQALWPTGSLDHVAMRHLAVTAVVQYVTKESTPQGFRLPYWMTWGAMVTQATVGVHILGRLVKGAARRAWITGPHPGPFGQLIMREYFATPALVMWALMTVISYCGARGITLSWRSVLPVLSRNAGTTRTGPAAEAAPAAPGGPPPAGATPGAGGAAPGPAGGAPPSGGTPAAGAPAPPSPPVMEQPATPEDPENAANASEDLRTMEMPGKIVGVLGQNFDKDLPVNHLPVVGVLVGPCQRKPNVYSKTVENLKAAINERIIKKARKPKLCRADRVRISRLVRKAMSNSEKHGVFSKSRIQEWAIQHFNLEEMKSQKWSLERFRNALKNLYEKDPVEFMLKAGIKPECMEEGKAPRMLIADGDEGQLMALAVIKCFEELLFKHFEERSIKHLSKHEAMERVVRVLKKKGARAVEGDGSAWDTTCGVLVRSLIENPILFHIFRTLAEFGVIPETWMAEHHAACTKEKLKLFFSNKFQKVTVTIDAIRRSGHRGTSCLNWWINFTMWVSSIFKEPERFLDPDVRKGTDLTEKERWWNGTFEGDDSLCTMCPPMLKDDKMSDIFCQFWSDAGFNMKIVYCDRRATFTGWHLVCENGELTDVRAPELPRALANSGVSVSPSAVQAAKDGKMSAIKVIAAASALARASDFSGILPTVSNKYLQYANECSKSDYVDRECSIRCFGFDGHSAKEVRERIEERNLGVTHQDEQKTLEMLGFKATHDELMTFTEHIWDLEPATLTAYQAFRESLPASWRME